MKCCLCKNETVLLPNAGTTSVTTDGRSLDKPFTKYACPVCGLVQSLTPGVVNYDTEYHFYDRPSMRQFNVARYENYANIVLHHLVANSRVLEVGCGAGWVLKELQDAREDIDFYGLEPSFSAVDLARATCPYVYQGSDTKHSFEDKKFDLIYSINVIEHVPDPISFLRNLKGILTENGRILVICPNGNNVHSEIMFADHLYTYSSSSLMMLAESAGLRTVSWRIAEDDAFQIICMQNVRPLIDERMAFLNRWSDLDLKLARRAYDLEKIWCFGAGETSDLLRTYCPIVWENVVGYVMDSVTESTLNDLPVKNINELDDYSNILLGVVPHKQKMLHRRLAKNHRVICWDDLIDV